MWSKPDAIDSADFALDAAKHALEYYEDFFNVSYPLPKMGKYMYDIERLKNFSNFYTTPTL